MNNADLAKLETAIGWSILGGIAVVVVIVAVYLAA